MLPLLIGMGVMGMASASMAQKDADREAANGAESYGIKVANIDFAAERVASTLSTKMRGLEEQRLAATIDVDKDQAKAESDAIVSAAQAGVSGQSIDAVKNDTKRTAGEIKGGLSKQVRQASLQLSQDYVDNYVNAEMNKGKLDVKQASKGERTMKAALGFASGFLGGL